jgi:hypothetical protein
MKYAIVTGVLMGAMISTQLLAAESVCLTRSRLVSARAIDENTIEMVDRQMNRFTVRMERPCANLGQINPTLVYRFWGNLSCLDSSVSINVAAPGRPANNCRVASVEAGAPAG